MYDGQTEDVLAYTAESFSEGSIHKSGNVLDVLSESRKLPANPEACFKAAEKYMTDAMADDRKPDEPVVKKLLKGKW